jgi:hypothetical protein
VTRCNGASHKTISLWEYGVCTGRISRHRLVNSSGQIQATSEMTAYAMRGIFAEVSGVSIPRSPGTFHTADMRIAEKERGDCCKRYRRETKIERLSIEGGAERYEPEVVIGGAGALLVPSRANGEKGQSQFPAGFHESCEHRIPLAR